MASASGCTEIDAPESSQTCLDAGGRTWRCGQRAALALQDLIGRRTITRDERDVDRYGRIVGRCLVGGIDINEWLVSAWAMHPAAIQKAAAMTTR